jgi:hypothetical protein
MSSQRITIACGLDSLGDVIEIDQLQNGEIYTSILPVAINTNVEMMLPTDTTASVVAIVNIKSPIITPPEYDDICVISI